MKINRYKSLRTQTFLAGTLGYALYYVCRLSMGVMKQPLIDAGLLNATQLGVIGACLYWAYAVGKLVNGYKTLYVHRPFDFISGEPVYGCHWGKCCGCRVFIGIHFCCFCYRMGYQRLGSKHGRSCSHCRFVQMVPIINPWHVLWVFQRVP